jgi:hypothetical protein
MSVLLVAAAPLFAARITAILPKMPMTCTRLPATLGFAFFGQTAPLLRCCFAPSGRDNFKRRLTHHIAKCRRRGGKKASALIRVRNALLGRDLPLVITAQADAFYGLGT